MKKITSRNFTVEYFEKQEAVWIVKSHLADEDHEITVEVEINLSDMVLTNAKIRFTRCPLEHCRMIESLASKMIGIKVDYNFSRNMMNLFMGAQGCPNIMSLLTISVPGIIYYYYPYLMKIGKMKYEEWDQMIRTDLKDACIGHTMV